MAYNILTSLSHRLIQICTLAMLFGCPVYDPPNPGPSYIYNCSEQAVYVYQSCIGKLELVPELKLFEPKNKQHDSQINCDLTSPEYRVNAYQRVEVLNPFIGKEGSCNDTIAYFFIKEDVMRRNSWNEIVNQQLYEKVIKLSLQEYNESFRLVTYTP